MAVDITPATIISAVRTLSDRMDQVEQTSSSSSSSSPGSGNFTQITVGAPGGPTVTILATATAPTNLKLDWGSFFSNIYILATWDGPSDQDSATEYEVQIAKKNADGTYDLTDSRRTAGPDMKIDGLAPNTTYGIKVYSVNRIGVYSDPLPATGYADITTGDDKTIPGAVNPSSIQIGRGATSVIVSFNPVSDQDVINGNGVYIVQISTDNTFATVFREIRSSATVVAFNDITAEGTFYARVAAVDASGNQGPWSVSGAATTGGGVIDSMLVGNFSAAHITFGTMSGDRISANSLDAATIKTSSLTAANITLSGGALIAGNPGGSAGSFGLLINSQGLRLYKNGVVTMALDAPSGDATFTGTISGSTIVGGTITGGLITGAVFDTGSSYPFMRASEETATLYPGDGGSGAGTLTTPQMGSIRFLLASDQTFDQSGRLSSDIVHQPGVHGTGSDPTWPVVMLDSGTYTHTDAIYQHGFLQLGGAARDVGLGGDLGGDAVFGSTAFLKSQFVWISTWPAGATSDPNAVGSQIRMLASADADVDGISISSPISAFIFAESHLRLNSNDDISIFCTNGCTITATSSDIILDARGGGEVVLGGSANISATANAYGGHNPVFRAYNGFDDWYWDWDGVSATLFINGVGVRTLSADT